MKTLLKVIIAVGVSIIVLVGTYTFLNNKYKEDQTYLPKIIQIKKDQKEARILESQLVTERKEAKQTLKELKDEEADIQVLIEDSKEIINDLEDAYARRNKVVKQLKGYQEEFREAAKTAKVDEPVKPTEADEVAAKIARGGVRLIDEPDLAEIYEYARKDPNWSEEQQGIHIGPRVVVGEELESSIREQIMQERYNLVID